MPRRGVIISLPVVVLVALVFCAVLFWHYATCSTSGSGIGDRTKTELRDARECVAPPNFPGIDQGPGLSAGPAWRGFCDRLGPMTEAAMEAEQESDWQRRARFARIFTDHLWGEGRGPVSGPGSSVVATARARAALAKVVEQLHIGSLLDAPCGDMTWMPLVLDELASKSMILSYQGADIVPALIAAHQKRFAERSNMRFAIVDVADVNATLPPVPGTTDGKFDLILCREMMQHLPFEAVHNVLRVFSRSGAKYLLTTTFYNKNGQAWGWARLRPHEIAGVREGAYKINLFRPPFCLPNPLLLFPDAWEDMYLALYSLPLPGY